MNEEKDRFREKRIGVLMGGVSGEREVSLRSGERVLDSLLSMGYRAIGIDADRRIANRLEEEKIEIAFIMLHGRFGEDGTIQGLLEQLEIPYTGSGVLASALAMNKVMSKKIFELEGIPSPQFLEYDRSTDIHNALDQITEQFPFPVVVKPVNEGSSLGVIIADDISSLTAALESDIEEFGHVMAEEFIDGASVTVGILGVNERTRALPVLELRPQTRFYDYDAKYTPGLTEFVCPAELEERVYRCTQAFALKAHNYLGCRGFSRVDMQVDPEKGPFVLEVNTIPGMTKLSDLPAEAEVDGMRYDELVEEILFSAPIDR